MTHHIHTCFVTYNRLDLTIQAITSYLEHVTLSRSWIVVDNGSTDGTLDWLERNRYTYLPLRENRYPGFACNRGWELMPDETTLLHRADNDFAFLPGWDQEVVKRFDKNQNLGQLGLRTNEEELFAQWNVGGNNVIRRELWDAGLRYDETPWPEYPPGYSEDSYFTPAVAKMGWQWGRVKRPCIESLASGDWDDIYYEKSYGDRRIERRD